MVNRMNEPAIKVDDVAFFPKHGFTPNKKITKAMKQATERMWEQTTGETERNICLLETWTVVGLAQYYKSTGTSRRASWPGE